jgi:hypothetical protein
MATDDLLGTDDEAPPGLDQLLSTDYLGQTSPVAFSDRAALPVAGPMVGADAGAQLTPGAGGGTPASQVTSSPGGGEAVPGAPSVDAILSGFGGAEGVQPSQFQTALNALLSGAKVGTTTYDAIKNIYEGTNATEWPMPNAETLAGLQAMGLDPSMFSLTGEIDPSVMSGLEGGLSFFGGEGADLLNASDYTGSLVDAGGFGAGLEPLAGEAVGGGLGQLGTVGGAISGGLSALGPLMTIANLIRGGKMSDMQAQLFMNSLLGAGINIGHLVGTNAGGFSPFMSMFTAPALVGSIYEMFEPRMGDVQRRAEREGDARTLAGQILDPLGSANSPEEMMQAFATPVGGMTAGDILAQMVNSNLAGGFYTDTGGQWLPDESLRPLQQFFTQLGYEPGAGQPGMNDVNSVAEIIAGSGTGLLPQNVMDYMTALDPMPRNGAAWTPTAEQQALAQEWGLPGAESQMAFPDPYHPGAGALSSLGWSQLLRRMSSAVSGQPISGPSPIAWGGAYPNAEYLQTITDPAARTRLRDYWTKTMQDSPESSQLYADVNRLWATPQQQGWYSTWT